MVIKGKIVRLRPAEIEDRRKIFEWLTQSDITPSMMGPPIYPDHPVPSWEEFKQDYSESFFKTSEQLTGKNYIILIYGKEIGTIGFDNLDIRTKSVDLDIWMKSEKFCGHGYGPDAVDALVQFLYHTHGVILFRVDPSSRNTRAITAYRKSGFTEDKDFISNNRADYKDTIVMIKRVDTKSQCNVANQKKIISP
jgi:diamine N-acetyltransferase